MVREGFALAREELIRTLTAYSGVTTGAGESDGSSLVCLDLAGETYLTRHNKSILIMSGAAQYETAGIESFNSTTGEITFGDALSTQIVAGVSFRVLNILPGSIHIEGYDYLSGEWRKVAVTASGEMAIHVTVADVVLAKISGQTVKLSSGTGPILAKISGETVELQSGTGPILAKVSGETVSIETPTMVKTGLIQIVTAGSGGQALYSGAVKSVLVKAVAVNSGMIAVGGSGHRPWYQAACSGLGLVLDGGEAVSLDVDDFDAIYVVAEVSGDQVSFIGVN